MRNIKILDCTLRDGGCVNNFDFGTFYMDKILTGLENSGVEIIELGYIDSEKGSEKERTQYKNEKVIETAILKKKTTDIEYVAMCDYGKFSFNELNQRTESSIDGIRLAFHKKDRFDILNSAKDILEKGYDLYIQPMTIMRYTDAEIIEFISFVNDKLSSATALYIVDSFGEMRSKDLNRIMSIFDHNLTRDMPIGLHAHNNLQLAYSNAVTLLDFATDRDLIFDSSIMGMGKGAGNMNTELFAEHLNMYLNKNYNITSLLRTIDETINQLKEKFFWGYSVEYYLSSANHCTPTYASYFYKKHMLSIEQVSELLNLISEDKKVSFDSNYADEIYYQYNSKGYDDLKSMLHLSEIIKGKKILLIAPGKSVFKYKEEIRNISNEKDIVTISLNNCADANLDYIFVTKSHVLDILKSEEEKLILTSNVSTDEKDGIIVNYTNHIDKIYKKTDNAFFIIMSVLKKLEVKDIILAGFDGFSMNVDENYYDEKFKRPIDREQALRRNQRTKKFLKECRLFFDLEFITPSLYDSED